MECLLLILKGRREWLLWAISNQFILLRITFLRRKKRLYQHLLWFSNPHQRFRAKKNLSIQTFHQTYNFLLMGMMKKFPLVTMRCFECLKKGE